MAKNRFYKFKGEGSEIPFEKKKWWVL